MRHPWQHSLQSCRPLQDRPCTSWIHPSTRARSPFCRSRGTWHTWPCLRVACLPPSPHSPPSVPLPPCPPLLSSCIPLSELLWLLFVSIGILHLRQRILATQ